MTFPALYDSWNYADDDCQSLLTRMWWDRFILAEGSISGLTKDMAALPSEDLLPHRFSFDTEHPSQASLENIADYIVSSYPTHAHVEIPNRSVEYALRKMGEENRWCLAAFIDRRGDLGEVDSTSVGVSFSPVHNALKEHLIVWIGLWLRD